MEDPKPPAYTVEPLTTELDNFRLHGQDDRDSLTIAMDFGTTYSGVAYAFSTDPETVQVINKWSGQERIAAKTPTVIEYNTGSDQDYKWGYDVPSFSTDKIERIKLLFDPQQKRPFHLPHDVQGELARLPKPVINVASDYMRAILEVANQEIEANYLDPELLKNFRRQYVLTVPAVWSDKAKDMTLKAARSAGMTQVDMITEPEAAALFTLHAFRSRGLKAGDAVILCDAGGGTVDLISYEIINLEPFEVKAITKPSGGIAGSTMINKHLEQEIQNIVGDEAYLKLKKTEGYRSAMSEFDSTTKVAFRGKGDPDKFISFPMANLKDKPAAGLRKDSLLLSGERMSRIYDPIVSDVEKMIADQVREVQIARLQEAPPNQKGVRAIFLVGGFGGSAYLKDVVEKSNPGVMVLQPRDAWAAIVRGAVMSKLELGPVVKSSKATKHYGTSCLMLWDYIRDKGQKKHLAEWTGDTRAQCMEWFIYMDDDLERGVKTRHHFHREFPGHHPSGDVLQIQDELYECTARLAPRHPQDNVNLNCRLFTDLNKVPKEHFVLKTRLRDGMPYCQLSYELLMESKADGLLSFSLEIGDEEYSAVEAQY